MRTVTERLKRRMVKDRPMATISIRIPADIVEDLKEIAPSLGFSGYQPLIRTYIGEGLRKDEARLQPSELQAITESLRRQGVSDQVISTAVAEALPATA